MFPCASRGNRRKIDEIAVLEIEISSPPNPLDDIQFEPLWDGSSRGRPDSASRVLERLVCGLQPPFEHVIRLNLPLSILPVFVKSSRDAWHEIEFVIEPILNGRPGRNCAFRPETGNIMQTCAPEWRKPPNRHFLPASTDFRLLLVLRGP